jgi:hypothetical protein
VPLTHSDRRMALPLAWKGLESRRLQVGSSAAASDQAERLAGHAGSLLESAPLLAGTQDIHLAIQILPHDSSFPSLCKIPISAILPLPWSKPPCKLLARTASLTEE